MGRKPTTLWKPDEAAEPDERKYITCAKGVCANLVFNQGDLCADHLPRENLDRSPSNLLLF